MCVNIYLNFIDIFTYGPQYDNIGSDNGLVLIRRQAIIWTNNGLVYRDIYASLGLDVLMMGQQ